MSGRIRVAIIISLIVVAGIIVVVIAGSRAPQTSEVTLPTADTTESVQSPDCLTDDSGACLVMPAFQGDNLDGETLSFPADLAGRYNLVVMPFLDEQQVNAREWVPLFQDLATIYDDIAYYSLAPLPDLAPAIRFLVVGGTSAVVGDPDIRRVTVIAFLDDQQTFLDALDIASTEEIQAFIVTESGEVLWRVSGDYSDETADNLREALAGILQIAE